MTAIPSKASLTGSTVTQGQFKTSLDTLNDYLTGLLGSDGTSATARTALGVINATAPTYAQVISALGYTPPQSGGTGASGTWPINISGNAATLGGFSASSFTTAEYVNLSFSLFQNFNSLSVGASRSTGSPSYFLWSTNGSQAGRGAYYTNMFYIAYSGKSGYQVNVGNCRITLFNYTSTKTIQVNLSAVINFASDDSYAFQIYKNGSYAATFGAYSARGVQPFNFGTFTVEPNTTTTFDLYGSILGGSGGDSLIPNSFTATYIQAV
jgi:hypothetical protein